MKGRELDVQRFLEYAFKKREYIESSARFSINKEHLLNAINTYHPEVIVKACVGGGSLLAEMAAASKGRIVVVDPSISIIRKFIKDYGQMKNLQFIAGDFSGFPIDYYAADMIVAIDNLSFIESSSAIDEFRRALRFDGILYIASPVLDEHDEEGILDDYMRMLFPLHNEFYMAAELKTVLGLNEFNCIKETIDNCTVSVPAHSEFFAGIYEDRKEECVRFIESQSIFDSRYGFNNGEFIMPHYTGIFMRIKPDYAYEKPTAGSL